MSRAATQESTILFALVSHCGKVLTPDTIDKIVADLVKEMRDGPTAWAFSPQNDSEEKILSLQEGWRDMETAPLDGTHCILAVKQGAFIYSLQGAYQYGQWNVVNKDNVEPLCWMPNIRLPDHVKEKWGL
jgi:hypothetical protein